MAEIQMKSWTISAGAVGKKPVRRSFGSASPAMRIKANQQLTTVTWSDDAGQGAGRQVWGGVLSTLVNAE